jgi:hypothetical protein
LSCFSDIRFFGLQTGNNRIPPAPGAADTPAIFFRLLNNFSLRNLYAAGWYLSRFVLLGV